MVAPPGRDRSRFNLNVAGGADGSEILSEISQFTRSVGFGALRPDRRGCPLVDKLSFPRGGLRPGRLDRRDEPAVVFLAHLPDQGHAFAGLESLLDLDGLARLVGI